MKGNMPLSAVDFMGFFRRRESVADNLYPPRDEKLDAAMKDER